MMTQKERGIAALTGKIPDQVPTFELEFQLEKEMFGAYPPLHDVSEAEFAALSAAQRDRLLHRHAEFLVEMYEKLEYFSIPTFMYIRGGLETELQLVRILREMVGERVMLHTHGDGTFALPDGNQMYEFAYRIADDPEGLHEEARRMMRGAIEANKRKLDAGIDLLILCSDYCYNSGPFISPQMFSELIAPYLTEIVREARRDGAYVVKHTDGNIMPILDQLVAAQPHALHSLDPMAGVDIAEVKRLYGDRIALCGNVNCALMQTGTEQEVIDSAMYGLTHAKPGGGYVFCTSNVPFRGLPADRYELILDVWRKHRVY